MKQQYTVEGDFDLMLKWDEYFGSTQSASVSTSESLPAKSKNDMRYLLSRGSCFGLPPVLITLGWFDQYPGSIALPLVFYKNKKTPRRISAYW